MNDSTTISMLNLTTITNSTIPTTSGFTPTKINESIIVTTSGVTTTTTTTLAWFNSKNLSDYDIIKMFLNSSDTYSHQNADLIEATNHPVKSIHAMIWTITILTYLLAIPIVTRMVRAKFYQTIIDYFSFHLVICAFIAWLPTVIFLFYYWFQIFTLRLCRLHYVILSTNETVPLFFVLYMIIERFFYAYPRFKQRFTRFSHMYFIHFYAVFTWLLIMLTYSLASPFRQVDLNSPYLNITRKYCSYNFIKLTRIATARSIIYFCFLIPAMIFIICVLRYFYLMRGTNQIPAIQKLWTIRVTVLLCILVFYDIYLYYLEHVTETFRSFLIASLLRSTFYLVQLFVIFFTELYWIEFIYERFLCLFCICFGQRRKTTIPTAIPIETEITTFPYSESGGHYSLVDDTVVDEFDRPNIRPEPTLRVII